MEAARRVGDWFREGWRSGGEAFLQSVVEEFGLRVPEGSAAADAADEAWTVAGDDESRAEAIFRERIDRRENPSLRGRLDEEVEHGFWRAIMSVLREELERFHEQGNDGGNDPQV